MKVNITITSPMEASTTALASMEIAQALSIAKTQPSKATAMIKTLMQISPKHAIFVMRKLMLLDLRIAPQWRIDAVVRPMLEAGQAEHFFPLDVPELTKQRIDHSVVTICMWYSRPEDLQEDLRHAVKTFQGRVSWLWVELVARLLEGGVKIAPLGLDRTAYDAASAAVSAVQELRGDATLIMRYVAVQMWIKEGLNLQ